MHHKHRLYSLGLAAVLVWFLSQSPAFGKTPPPPVSPNQIQAALPQDLQHPYLYFTEADKPALRARIENDPESKRIYQHMKEAADACLTGQVRQPDLMALAFAYQITDDKRYAQKAYELMPKEYPQPQGGFDLPASRACRGAAPLYDWLYTGLTPEQREPLKQRLIGLVNQVRGKYDQTWWVTTYRCNWNPVCNSGAGIAAVALLADDPTLVDVLAEAYNGIYRTYDEIGPQGDWCEGVNYWSYGLFVSLYFTDPLKRITQGEFDLFGHEKIQANPVSFGIYTLISPGPHVAQPYEPRDWKSVDFEDSGDKREDSSFGYNKLAAETGSGQALWLKNHIFAAGGDSVFDILWPAPELRPETPRQASQHFQQYGWVIMRSDFDNPAHVILAAVAAEHWDPTREVYICRFPGDTQHPASEKPWGFVLDSYNFTHSHLEAGHFNLYWQGESFISDIGNIGYPEDFWTTNRWNYPQANSTTHNVVFVNGEQQISGKGIGGKVLEFRTGPDRDYALMDGAGAYPGKELKGWRRHLLLTKPDITLVLDEITAPAGAAIDVRFHTETTPANKGSFVLLQGKSGTMALIPLASEPLELLSREHQLPHAQNGTMQTFPYTDLHMVSKIPHTQVATLILPVADQQEAQTIFESLRRQADDKGNLTISFQKSGKEIQYQFEMQAEGLRLAQ